MSSDHSSKAYNRSQRDQHNVTNRKSGVSNETVSPDNNNFKDEAQHRHHRKDDGRFNFADIFDPAEANIIVELLVLRFAAFVVWTGAILYATYRVYLACDEILGPMYLDPIMNPGSFTGLLNRGKDRSDHEYEMFLLLYTTRLWFWFGFYAVMSRIIQPAFPKEWKFISLTLSVIQFLELVGIRPTVFLILQPIVYWLIAKSGSRLLMWTTTLLFIYNLNEKAVQTFIPDDSFAEYFFVIVCAWNCCRCISFCCDVWKRTGDNVGLTYMGNVIRYCFYLPLALSGPLITYNHFEEAIINKDIEELKRRDMSSDFVKLLKTLLRLFAIGLFCEIILHIFYFRALAVQYQEHRQMSLWVVCGIIYWLGQFFSMKYKILYGFPSCLAEFDGIEMYPLPTCPSYMHRYSALWRDFDRGLYRFLVNYIYVPTLTWFREADKENKIPLDIIKLCASFLTFVYVYVWHSLSFEVFVWTLFNFIGITIERIGSVMKREIDKRMVVEPIHWDFIVEPIVTIPLAAMSILNSAIFCGSLDVAISFGSVLWRRRADSWVFLFLYCFTHTAVTHRTWRHKLSILFQKTCKKLL